MYQRCLLSAGAEWALFQRICRKGAGIGMNDTANSCKLWDLSKLYNWRVFEIRNLNGRVKRAKCFKLFKSETNATIWMEWTREKCFKWARQWRGRSGMEKNSWDLWTRVWTRACLVLQGVNQPAFKNFFLLLIAVCQRQKFPFVFHPGRC